MKRTHSSALMDKSVRRCQRGDRLICARAGHGMLRMRKIFFE